MNDESFTDEEKHNGDLGNGEKAPDGSLLHQVRRNKRGKNGAKQEKEASLENHALLFVQCEERSKHEEAMNAGSHHEIAGICHGDRPTEVNHRLGLEGAKGLSTEPFSGLIIGNVHDIEGRHVSKEVACKQKETSNETESLDYNVSVTVLFALGQTSINDVAKVWLQANVKESSKGENTIDPRVANRVIETSCKKQILNCLQKFHGEKEKNATGKFGVVCSGVHPPVTSN